MSYQRFNTKLSVLRSKIFITLILVSCLLASCTSLRVSPQNVTYRVIPRQVRQAKLREIQQWTISGAFGITRAGRSEIANYVWDEFSQKNYLLRISSALDLYSLTLLGRGGQVTLFKGRQKQVSAGSVESLMQRVVGWTLPVENLYYWIRALPAPGSHGARYDQYGHLISLTQNGWQIAYSSFIPVGNVDLPRILTISRPGLSIKIAIKNWQLSRPKIKLSEVSP